VALAGVLASGPALGADNVSLIDDGDRALERNAFDRAEQAYGAALSAGGLDRRSLARAYAGMGILAAARNEADKAYSAFVRTLCLDPEWVPLPFFDSPKVQGPLGRARLYWRMERRPSLQSQIREVPGGQNRRLEVDVTSDPLGMIDTVAVSWVLDGEKGSVARPYVKQTAVFELPAVPPSSDPVDLAVRALDTRGSVIVESTVTLPPSRMAQKSVAFQPAKKKVSSDHAAFLDLGIFANAQKPSAVGSEIGLGYALFGWGQVGMGASLGDRIGARLALGVRLPGYGLLKPVLQIRGVVIPLREGGAELGGGLGLALTAPIGPGRFLLGAGATRYSAAEDRFAEYAIHINAGYQLLLIPWGGSWNE
jgi:hypothetical protein